MLDYNTRFLSLLLVSTRELKLSGLIIRSRGLKLPVIRKKSHVIISISLDPMGRFTVLLSFPHYNLLILILIRKGIVLTEHLDSCIVIN